ncbi:MAG: acyltransferase family protein [Methylophilaceae bacterium]
MKLEHSRQNNFGVLRLVFASLVIVAHSPQFVDDNKSRELLTQLFGTLTFGELAVDGFFLISGYLIFKSFQNSSSIKSFFLKRVLRIYPGFIAAFLICTFVVAPISGVGWSLIKNLPFQQLLTIPLDLIFLKVPAVEGAFLGAKVTDLNGSMWTIGLEFLCYISLPMMFLLGLHKRKYYIATLLFSGFVFITLLLTDKNYWFPYPLDVGAYSSSRLWTAFLIGGAFYAFRDKIIWNTKFSLICLVLLLPLMFFKYTAEIAIFTFGAYLMFNFALNYKNEWLNSIGSKNDISYGIYLYGWPIQALIVQSYPDISPWALTISALLLAAVAGYLSWIYVERPFSKFKNIIKT